MRISVRNSSSHIFDLLVLKGDNVYTKIELLPILWTRCYMNWNKKEIIDYNLMHLFKLRSFNIILIQQKRVSVLQ